MAAGGVPLAHPQQAWWYGLGGLLVVSYHNGLSLSISWALVISRHATNFTQSILVNSIEDNFLIKWQKIDFKRFFWPRGKLIERRWLWRRSEKNLGRAYNMLIETETKLRGVCWTKLRSFQWCNSSVMTFQNTDNLTVWSTICSGFILVISDVQVVPAFSWSTVSCTLYIVFISSASYYESELTCLQFTGLRGIILWSARSRTNCSWNPPPISRMRALIYCLLVQRPLFLAWINFIPNMDK